MTASGWRQPVVWKSALKTLKNGAMNPRNSMRTFTRIRKTGQNMTGYDNIQQGLGQLISVLATARSQDVEKIEQAEELAMKYYTKNISYTGNGNGSVNIDYQSGTLQGALLASSVKGNSYGMVFLIGIKGATNNSLLVQGMYRDNRGISVASEAFMSINPSTHTLTISDTSGNSNYSGTKYNVLLFLS